MTLVAMWEINWREGRIGANRPMKSYLNREEYEMIRA